VKLLFLLIAWLAACPAPALLARPDKRPILTHETGGLRIYGDPADDYALEYSTDLKTWITIARIPGDGRTLIGWYGPGYYRARWPA
jgi:hypothetical protein